MATSTGTVMAAASVATTPGVAPRPPHLERTAVIGGEIRCDDLARHVVVVEGPGERVLASVRSPAQSPRGCFREGCRVDHERLSRVPAACGPGEGQRGRAGP